MALKIPEILSQEEQQAILKQPNPRYPTGERNYVILRLMLDGGLRLSEITNLRWRDMNPYQEGKILIRQGKGKKDRLLWINGNTLKSLGRWQIRQQKEIGKCDYVFTTLKGTKLSGRYIEQMVKRYAEKADIDKNIHPHTLRHTFATDLLRKTKNLRLVQKALGHSSISTTTIYTHIVDDELEEALKTFREE